MSTLGVGALGINSKREGVFQMRKQIREIRIIDLFRYFFLPPVIVSAAWIIYSLLLRDISKAISAASLVAVILITYLSAKRFLIGAVLMYKAFAPMSLREQCRFEPTCSTYMIMAIKKYGIIIGLIKGICRIVRCHPPNGGVDYP